jgi:hypothetical protein
VNYRCLACPGPAGTSLPIPGCPAPSRKGNPAFRNSTSADAPEQPVLDVPNHPDSHRPRRIERQVGARLSQAQDVVDCVAVPGCSPADSRPGCIFIHRRRRRELTVLPRTGRSTSRRTWRPGARRTLLPSTAHRHSGVPLRESPSDKSSAYIALRRGTVSPCVIEKIRKNARGAADMRDSPRLP